MLSQAHISPQTPTGATLGAGGATFRAWAPEASAVYLHGTFGGQVFDRLTDDRLLQKDARGYWTGFQDGARDGDRYRFWVEGAGSKGHKRDPYARELDPADFPDSFSIVPASPGTIRISSRRIFPTWWSINSISGRLRSASRACPRTCSMWR